MDDKKQTGFTLFPQPPTPPAKKTRTKTKSSLSSTSSKLTKNRSTQGRGHRRKSSTSTAGETSQPGLIPAPLKIRRAAEEIPPLPTLLPPLPPTTPPRTKKQSVIEPQTPDDTVPQLPAIPRSSPFPPLPRTPTPKARLKARTVAEFIELEAGNRKRASARLSQWLDLEDGEIDRKRLSRYLGSVLDNTFEIPTFETGPRSSLAFHRRASKLDLASLTEQCECPPDAVICLCSSSPEFERFRNWSQHKTNSSISSTACLVGVPRARFHPNFFAIPEPDVAELASPPGLSYDTEDEVGDWTSPKTPSRDDIFAFSPNSRSYSSKYAISSPTSTSGSSASKFQSFSRPFRPDSSYRSACGGDSTPSTPSRSQSRSTSSKNGGYLTSISTMSSFDFHFDFKSRCESIAFQKKLDLEIPPYPSLTRELSSHLRLESKDSFASQTSQVEVNTATAMSGSSIKPVLVTNAAKRSRNTSGNQSQGSNATFASAQTSTSSVSIPDYWQQFNAGIVPRSRSTTNTSNAESVAFSAMLTMPLLSPKESRPDPRIVAGNAFAQRSNTSATMPCTMPQDDIRQFSFGLNDTAAENMLNRSKTTPNLNLTIDTGKANNTAPQLLPQPSFNTHIQAHAAASARLKAYMNTTTTTTTTTNIPLSPLTAHPPSPILRPITQTSQRSPRRKKSYICTDTTGYNRNDSGVFGRLSMVGGVPGRREFSEPQYYRG